MNTQIIQRLVNPQRPASTEEVITGQVPVEQLKRLLPQLRPPYGELQASLAFSKAKGRDFWVALELSGSLCLTCQRCMQDFALPVKISGEYMLCQDEDKADALVPEQDTVVLEQGNLNIFNMIEDELILFLPPIAMHELSECPSKAYMGPQGENNDKECKSERHFGILASLKDKQTKN